MDEGSFHDDCASKQKPPRNTFRRPRAGRACGSCHSKRVRCDAGIRGLPCTNCTAFSVECSIPPKKKEREGGTVGELRRTRHRKRNVQEIPASKEPSSLPELEYAGNYVKLIQPEVAESMIQDPGRVFYLAEMSNMSVLVREYNNPASKVHYQLPSDWEQRSLVSNGTDDVELEILRARGALSLPSRETCDQLVHAFFTWVAPIVPIINKTSFMKQYRDPNNPPSVLLMQAILLAGSRVCPSDKPLDSSNSSATLFYQRAKALYDADYEKDRVTTVQSLILLGWYWEDPSTVTKNVFYWNGLAVSIAHGFGMHRNAADSDLSVENKRLWKRIWWTLYTRDRSVAAALGRPCHIDMMDSDVEMITNEDFIEDDAEPNATHIQFFLSYVRLSIVMDRIMLENYSTKAKPNAAVFTQCDQALIDWLDSCPRKVRWVEGRYEFWSTYLHCIFQTASCLLYRAYLPTSLSRSRKTPRWSPAFQSAEVITSLVEDLMTHDALQYTPPFMIYTLLSSLIVQIYRLRKTSPDPITASSIKEQISTCMLALEAVSKTWLVATMVHKLCETILGWCVPDASVHESLEPVGFGITVGDLGAQTPDEYALLSERRGRVELPVRTKPLTKGLKDYLDAALQFTGSSASELSNDYIIGSERPRQQTKTPAPRTQGLQFLPEDEDLEWDEGEKPRTPVSTGLNPALWSEFFGCT
ncbi:hypothetical protein N431DRAFT_361501 [Stipitochalara longipes BDJ]|nr:hypothetical protein N431DRAFT_361501 [Stipitochalara longipes BDJ]